MTSRADATDAAELGSFRAVEVAIAAWRERLDPARLTGPVAVQQTERVDVAIRQLTASKVGLAGRVEATRAFKATHRDAAGWLASSGGGSVGDANRMLRTAERLTECPQTKEAFEAGTLSLAEAELVSQAVEADPSAEKELVDFAARRHNLHGLKERTDRVRRGAHRAEDEAKRAAAIRASRKWVMSNDRVDGAPCIDAKFVPQDYAAAQTVLARFQQRIFEDARLDGRREPEMAYLADAVLAAILTAGATVGITSPALSTAPRLGAFVPGSSWTLAPGPSGDPATTPSAPGATPARATGSSAAPADARAMPAPDSTTGRADADAPARGGVANRSADQHRAGIRPAGPSSANETTLFPPDTGDPPSPTDDEPASLPGGSSRDARRPCVIVDAIALQRGHVASGEMCEIPGVGPVEVAWARKLMGDGIFDVVVHNGVDITTFATTTRHIPRALEVALAVRDPECTDPGCTQRDHLEIDHIIDYADTHDTSYRNLRHGCGPGHDDKTQGRLTFERHDNEWWATPTGEPGGTGAPPQPRASPVGEHLSRWNLDHLPDERAG